MVMSGEGWEYVVFKTTSGCMTLTSMTAAYFTRSASNQEAIIKQLAAEKISESKYDITLQKRLFKANIWSGVTVGGRLALIPISLCAITLSSLSYRNDVYPLDLALLYGTAGGLFGLRGGAKTAAIASASAALFGMSSGLLLVLILNRSNISIADIRHQFSQEYKAKVEYENMMKVMRERDAEHRRSLIEKELQQMQEAKRRS